MSVRPACSLSPWEMKPGHREKLEPGCQSQQVSAVASAARGRIPSLKEQPGASLAQAGRTKPAFSRRPLRLEEFSRVAEEEVTSLLKPKIILSDKERGL